MEGFLNGDPLPKNSAEISFTAFFFASKAGRASASIANTCQSSFEELRLACLGDKVPYFPDYKAHLKTPYSPVRLIYGSFIEL